MHPKEAKSSETAPLARRGATCGHVATILVLIACVVAISAHAPSTTYAYAQLQQIGAVVGTIQGGEWLLPRDQMGGLARKPQLYAWLDAPILMLTGIYDDFTFRLPTIVASLVMGVLVYVLGRRWFGPRAGLLAACGWGTIHHMAKLMYVAVTDMLLTVFVTASILCADRLLFHRAARSKRGRWLVGLWATMILGAMSKGWGVVNLVLVGLTLATATAVLPGFGALRRVAGGGRKAMLAIRLILRRWRKAAKAVRLGWGLAAMAAALAPVWVGMFARGGEEFARIVRYEFWSRITGGGEIAPHPTSVPPVVHLLYYMLPVTVFAAGAMVLVRPRRWFSRRSPTALPLCWIAAVVLPFSLTHGFRHDYLLPCYAAGALMGAWAIEEVARRGRAGGRVVSNLRHVFAGCPIVIGLLLIVVPVALVFNEHMPPFITENIRVPAIIEPETWWIFAALIPAGALGIAIAIRASLAWRIRALAALAIVGMLGVMFVERHAISRHAQTGDGEKMLRFGRRARRLVGSDEFAVARAHKLAAELYLGRFGADIMDTTTQPKDREAARKIDKAELARRRARAALENLERSAARWLITCDKALVALGAAEADRTGPYKLKLAGGKVRFRTLPESLGTVELATQPIISQRWGRIYLIRLDARKIAKRRAEQMHRRARAIEFMSGKQDWDW